MQNCMKIMQNKGLLILIIIVFAIVFSTIFALININNNNIINGVKIEGIKVEDISAMAMNAEKEANPLYPVPKLMTAKELEGFYYQIADWS